MSFYNVFQDKGIIYVIPFFTGLYMAFYTKKLVIPLLLSLSVLIYYLIVVLLAKKITLAHKQNKLINGPINRDEVFNELMNEKYSKINGLFSLSHWALLAVTAIILYNFRDDFVPFLLFWFLIVGFVYNLIILFILEWDRIKEAFSGR